MEEMTIPLPNAENPHLGQQDQIAISLVPRIELDSCSHWIGLFKQMPQSRGDLFEKNTYHLFRQVCKNGLGETNPIMIADAAQKIARYLYLVPYKENCVKNLAREYLKVITAWDPVKLGIYLAPEIFKSDTAYHYLMNSLLENFTKHSQIREYFLLSKDRGINDLLSVVLSFKNKTFQGKENLHVYHY